MRHTIIVLLLPTLAQAQSYDPFGSPRQVVAFAFGAPSQAAPTIQTVFEQDYPAAHRQALRLNRPLVVWVGGNFCPECIKGDAIAQDFVHVFMREFDGTKGPMTVAAIPRDGSLLRVSNLWEWQDGHLGTIRDTLRKFRLTGAVTDQTADRMRRGAQGGMTWEQGQPQTMMMSNPFRANLSPYGGSKMMMQSSRTYQQMQPARFSIRSRNCAT